MSIPLRMLIVSYSEEEFNLLEHALLRSGYKPNFERAVSLIAITSALDKKDWDVIVFDYAMTQYIGTIEMNLLEEKALGLPTIILYDEVSEEFEVDKMIGGAYTCVNKGNPELLAFAIKQELRNAKERIARKQAEQALYESKRTLSTLMSNLPGMAYRCLNDKNWTMKYVSKGCLKLTGYQQSDLENNRVISYGQLIHSKDIEQVWDEVQKALSESRPFQLEYRIIDAAGVAKWVWEQGQGVISEQGELLALEGFITDITERKKMVYALRESEEQYRTIFETAATALMIVEEDTTVSLVNSEFEKYTGFSKEEVEGKKSWTEFVRNVDLERMKKYHYLRRIDINAVPSSYEFKFTDKHGNEKDAYIRVALIPGTKKSVISIFDLTERKLAEEVLVKSRNFHLTLFEEFPALIWRASTDAKCDYFNKSWLNFTGRTLEQELGDGWAEGVHPEDLERCLNTYLDAFNSHSPFEMEYRLRHYSGEYHWITDFARPFYDLDGNFAGYIGSCYDITERKLSEKKLQEHLLFLQQLIDAIPNPIFYKDNNCIYRGCNSAFEAYIGLTKQEVVGMSVYDLAPKDLADNYFKMDYALIREPGVQSYEASVLYADGTRHDVIFNKATYFNNDGVVSGLVGVIIDITNRKQIEKSLRENEEQLRVIFENAAIGVALADMDGRVLKSNPAFQKMLGYNDKELHNMVFTEFTHPDDALVDMELHKELMTGKREHFQMEKRYIQKDGQIIWARLNVSLIRRAHGEPHFAIGMIENITERKQAEEKFRTAHQQLLDIIEFLPDATFAIDQDKKVIAWNRAIEEMTGVIKEDIMGKGDYVYALPFYGNRTPILIDLIFTDDNDTRQKYDYIKRNGNTLYSENCLPLKGKGAFLLATASPLYDNNGKIVGAIETIRDITDRKRMENQLQYLATNDSLTNTPNRYSLEENLKRAVAKAKRGEKSALIIIDLDNFKLVNDILGHAAGDELLIILVNILKSNLREGDFLARMGGDEFAILLEGITVEDAGAIAEGLRRLVDESELCLLVHKDCFNLTISLGVVMIDGTLNSQQLLSHADTALYTAKEKGRNRVVFIKPFEHTAKLTETNELVALIKNALKENRFVLYFQPVARISDRKVTHYEALIRLEDNSGELILPGKFIPAAERFGLMSQIDRWVVRSSIDALQKYPDLNLFVNLSGVSLGDEELLRFIEASIQESEIISTRIGFEITETAAVKDLSLAERWIRSLKKIGCRFALDDFGIGFSSFSYLRMLPVDYIKIDGSFVRNLDKDPTNRALIQAMNDVSHALDKVTIAEFVENENTLRILMELGIDCGQGYYLGKPLPSPGE